LRDACRLQLWLLQVEWTLGSSRCSRRLRLTAARALRLRSPPSHPSPSHTTHAHTQTYPHACTHAHANAPPPPQISLQDGTWPRSQLQSTLEAAEEERLGVGAGGAPASPDDAQTPGEIGDGVSATLL
jgi:hypothetical protein